MASGKKHFVSVRDHGRHKAARRGKSVGRDSSPSRNRIYISIKAAAEILRMHEVSFRNLLCAGCDLVPFEVRIKGHKRKFFEVRSFVRWANRAGYVLEPTRLHEVLTAIQRDPEHLEICKALQHTETAQDDREFTELIASGKFPATFAKFDEKAYERFKAGDDSAEFVTDMPPSESKELLTRQLQHHTSNLQQLIDRAEILQSEIREARTICEWLGKGLADARDAGRR